MTGALASQATLRHSGAMHAASAPDPPNEARDGPLLIGRVLDGKGGARPIDWAAARGFAPLPAQQVMWLHLNRTGAELPVWLKHTLCLPQPTAELLVSDNTRPRAFREGEALVATLRDLNFNPGAEPEDMISMQLWSDGRRVVTLRRDPQQSPIELCAMLDRGEGPRDASAIITQIAELMIDHLSGAVIDINDAIDALEANHPALPMAMRVTRIADIRRDCLALQRHISPQHEALQHIAHDAPAWFEDHDRREIAESIARLRRNLDDINISKESAVVLQDELRAQAQAVSQDATYKLGVMAGVFLPLTFFTGLLGINVAGIPGADHPMAFQVVIGLCVLITAIIIAIFHARRWL